MSEVRLFRKKPITVEAVQFTDFGQHGGAYEFAQANGIGYFDNGDRAWPEVHTPEGLMRMEPLDWLITGVKGEKYPCKPDVFEATYEPVAETDPPMRASWSEALRWAREQDTRPHG